MPVSVCGSVRREEAKLEQCCLSHSCADFLVMRLSQDTREQLGRAAA